MKHYKLWIILVTSMLCGCKACDDAVVQAVVALGNVKLVVKRISGIHYLKFSKGDPADTYSESNGYLCVSHNPGCGWWGNNGKDKFFNPDVPLPPLCTIVGTDFVQFWPDGIASSGSSGGLGGWGSYGAHLDQGSPDGSSPYVVPWNNACQGDFSSKVLYYHISFLVSMPEGTDMGEPVFDQGVDNPQVCLPSGYSTASQSGTPTTVIPSGFEGTATVCNPSNVPVSGQMVIWATLTTALSGAQGVGVMKDTSAITFPAGPGAVSATYRTAQKYQQGTWNVTLVKLIGVTGNFSAVPFMTTLPGSLGNPSFDFSGGGACGIQ